MKTTFSNFPLIKKEILVIGDAMLDLYWNGSTDRISPEAPVPIVKVDVIKNKAGGAANVAVSISALGIQSRLISFIGIDEAANKLKKILENCNVRYNFVELKNHPTITKLRITSHFQQLIRIDFEKKIKKENANLLDKYILHALKNTSIVVLSDYSKGSLLNVKKIIKYAQNAKIPILVDPKGNNFLKYQGATLLTPNISEFENIIGKKCETEEKIIKYGMKIIKDYNLKALVVTRSENGITLLQPEKNPFHVPTKAKKVFDVTGAGDTVIAVLATRLSLGESFEQSCFIANTAAGIAVGKPGNAIVKNEEIKNAILHDINRNNLGIINEVQLEIIVSQAKKKGEKIVMTNGCFDILHAGHVKYLHNARNLGDRLIVAVNSDESIKRLKGKKRPINSLIHRMLVLASLKCVDWVISFEDNTPIKLIKKILPDFLVKGGDYKNIEDIAGSKEVIKKGGKVKILKFESNFSTTKVIKNLYKN